MHNLSPDERHLVSMYAGIDSALEVLDRKMKRAKSNLARERIYYLYEGIANWRSSKDAR